MALLLRLLFIAIRLLLLVVSFVGWIVFVVGTIKLDKKLHSYYNNPDTFPFGPEYAKAPLNLAKVLFIPMWVFVASGLATYVSLVLHIFVCHDNIKHILHSALMFFNVFFMFGGSGTLMIAMAFSVGKNSDELRNTVHFDETLLRIVLYGTSVSVGMYWVSTFVWPLFNLKRKRVYYEEVTIQGPQKRYYGNSGRFSNSRELYQQVSQDEDWTD